MSTLPLPSSLYVSPVDNHGLGNTQALAGSQLWQDFFSQALAQAAETEQVQPAIDEPLDPEQEPKGGSDVLAQILAQTLCEVHETEIDPAEPLFLPKAEFEWHLLDKPNKPWPPEELVEQQQGLDFDNGWVRPLVINGRELEGEPGPAPEPRDLFLPIAELETDLLDKPNRPWTEDEKVEQQRALDFDTHWARPVVLENVRLAA